MPRECASVCVGGSLHNLLVVSGAPGVGKGGRGGGARQETKSDEKKGRQTVDREELVTREVGRGILVWESQTCVRIRETREGWPLLTVETEANGDSKSTYGCSSDSSCRYNIFLSCFG